MKQNFAKAGAYFYVGLVGFFMFIVTLSFYTAKS
jgi:hypothetical protein